MNRVHFNAQGVPLPQWKEEAGGFVKAVLAALGRKNWEVSILFCNNAYIKSLNARYRRKDEPTDVLSFPMCEAVGKTHGFTHGEPFGFTRGETGSGRRFLAGDIVISLDALLENAQAFNVCADEELRRLLVHGILHLDGRDHATLDPAEPMLQLQESILAQLSEKANAHSFTEQSHEP